MRKMVAFLIAMMIASPTYTAETDGCAWGFVDDSIDTFEIEEATEYEEPMNAGTIEVKPFYWADLGTFEITAYCGCKEVCCPVGGQNITASGTYATEGRTIGVDPNIIPLGAVVEIQFTDGTIHEYTAEDTGSAIRGNIIDLYFARHEDAVNFGRQTCRVFIKERNDGRN
jgi:3D (Asp-Asp-Asp) domain-containing protein